ncbi:hypothetical protein BS50DRAFT_578577 [Corynespora cassiicola Philippines]|uniref:Large ribosomal subunit protein bL28m n=1 Tax=Corynespora cassiicola Philippines TaxID=1448308 RepID=A0A2T2N6X5_CORCC|nr:hypothetical protein BS50DRAFT_578577 [Corynespora cassiicola Philippines]
MPPQHQLLSVGILRSRIVPQPLQRTFSTSATLYQKNPLQRRRGGDLGSHLPKDVIPKDAVIPEYPYGEAQLFKQSNRGLYGGQTIQFGNNVSPETETKTRRSWKPNILNKSLYSVSLKKRIQLRVTAKVLKTIDQEGGLDEYLLREGEARIKELGPLGWQLRWLLLQKPSVIERMRARALELGIPKPLVNKQWPSATQRAVLAARKKAADPKLQQERFARVERDALAAAEIEYRAHHKRADRKLASGIFDNKLDSLKLSYIREKHRAEYTAAAAEKFQERVATFPGETPEEQLQAYTAWRQEQIDKFGSYQAFKDHFTADKANILKTRIEEAGGNEAYSAMVKANLKKEIRAAETAQDDLSKPEEERNYLEWAIYKAELAHKAKDAQEYAQLLLAATKEATKNAEQVGAEGEGEGEGETEGQTDAWAEHAHKA